MDVFSNWRSVSFRYWYSFVLSGAEMLDWDGRWVLQNDSVLPPWIWCRERDTLAWAGGLDHHTSYTVKVEDVTGAYLHSKFQP